MDSCLLSLSVPLVTARCTDDANEVDQEGRTMLHCAVANEREAVVRLLATIRTSARHLMIDASVRDNRKRTPLYLAVQSGRMSLVVV